MSDLRFGLVGYGAIAAEHAAALTRLGCTITVVTGPNLDAARAFADKHGVARVGDGLKDVLKDDDVDAVVVASPNAVHTEQTIAALEGGKHVLCEVPLATSASDAEKVAEAAARADVVAMVCQTQRFWAPVAHLRELVEAGRLHVSHVIHLTALLRRENIGWTGRRRSWVDSVLWHHGAHAVDTALWLLDAPIATVRADAGSRQPKTDMPLDLSIGLRTTTGALASLALSYNSPQPLSELVVIGEEDAFRAVGGSLVGSRESVDYGDAASVQSAAIERQDDLFVRWILDGTPAGPTPESLLPVYSVLQSAADRIA